MTQAARFTKADVQRAVAGALAGGVLVQRIKVSPDGRIVLVRDQEGARRNRINPLDRPLHPPPSKSDL